MRESTPIIPAGIVLAAGASTRMGTPKALLSAPDGSPLAAWQAARLRSAGCAATVIVLGAQADAIQPALTGAPCTVNGQWAGGRCGSVQAGLRALPGFDAWIILPVDNVLVRDRTLAALARAPGGVARPWHGREPGRVLRIDASAAAAILAAAPDARIDDLLTPGEARLPVDDDRAGSNVNTPAEWAAACKQLANGGPLE